MICGYGTDKLVFSPGVVSTRGILQIDTFVFKVVTSCKIMFTRLNTILWHHFTWHCVSVSFLQDRWYGRLESNLVVAKWTLFYQRSVSLAQVESRLRSYLGKRSQYSEKATWSGLGNIDHLMCQHQRSNPDRTGERLGVNHWVCPNSGVGPNYSKC